MPATDTFVLRGKSAYREIEIEPARSLYLAKRLTYIGQTGRTLRERLLALANGTHVAVVCLSRASVLDAVTPEQHILGTTQRNNVHLTIPAQLRRGADLALLERRDDRARDQARAARPDRPANCLRSNG
jgi:hypothetical protein